MTKTKKSGEMLKNYRQLMMMHKKFELSKSMLTIVEERFLATVLQHTQDSKKKFPERRALVFDMLFQLVGVIDGKDGECLLKPVNIGSGKLEKGVEFRCPEPEAGSDHFSDYIDSIVQGALSGKKFKGDHPCRYLDSPELYILNVDGTLIIHRAGCLFYGPTSLDQARHDAIKKLVGFHLVA